MPATPNRFDPKYVIPRILQRWYWLVLGLTLGLILGLIALKLSVPQYKAKSTLLVKSFNLDSMGERDQEELDLKSKGAVDTVRAGLDKRDVYLAVANDPKIKNLENLLPTPKPTLKTLFKGAKSSGADGASLTSEKLAGKLRSWSESGSRSSVRFIDLYVTHTDPKVAAIIADSVTQHFVELSEQSKVQAATRSVEFLEKEAEEVEKKLEKVKTLLTSYSSPIDAENALLEYENQFIQIKTRYKELHPKYRTAAAEQELYKERLKAQLSRAIKNPIDAEYWESFKAMIDKIENPETFSTLREALLTRADILESEIDSKETLYNSLLERIETKTVSSNQSDAEVIPYDTAEVPHAPFSPNKKNVILASCLKGLALGILVAFFFQLADNKFHAVHEIEDFADMATLSIIHRLPEGETFDTLISQPLPRWVTKLAKPLQLAVSGKNSVHTEMYRVLRSSIQLLGEAKERKVTLITSSNPSEGKSTIAASTAIAFAKQGVNTVLVDLDLRKPSVHSFFGEPREGDAGIVHILNGTKSVDQALKLHPEIPNLSLIFSGEKAPNPGELMAPHKLKALIAALTARFDHVIIDTAPLLAVSDTRTIAPLVDNLCLVVRAGQTPRNALRNAMERLEADQITPAGIILNDYVQSRQKKTSYGYGYSGYGEYGES